MKLLSYLLVLGLLGSCSGLEESEKEAIRKRNAIGESIYRNHDEIFFTILPPYRQTRERYPWEDVYVGDQVKITKEFFRCKGNAYNSPKTQYINGQSNYTFDCGGAKQHSLPLKKGKEFIYPALIELLNYLQEKTHKKVVITCGYTCPTHHTYSCSSHFNRNSKHMIGAEVDFYVKGCEWNPQQIVALIKQYYCEHPVFKYDCNFTRFKLVEEKVDVSTIPWENKEILIKLFKEDEGRDLDNNHGFPYICIQLKWNREIQKSVRYKWKKAFNGYLRY